MVPALKAQQRTWSPAMLVAVAVTCTLLVVRELVTTAGLGPGGRKPGSDASAEGLDRAPAVAQCTR